ncbi:hypothetical protein TYRP_023195, partial [Tyrophagus putrescentiae]
MHCERYRNSEQCCELLGKARSCQLWQPASGVRRVFNKYVAGVVQIKRTLFDHAVNVIV